MKKLFYLLLLSFTTTFSQEFQGKAYYMSKLSVDKSWMDNPRFANRRGYLEDMMKKNTEKIMYLNLTQLSHFILKEKKLMLEKVVDLTGWLFM